MVSEFTNASVFSIRAPLYVSRACGRTALRSPRARAGAGRVGSCGRYSRGSRRFGSTVHSAAVKSRTPYNLTTSYWQAKLSCN